MAQLTRWIDAFRQDLAYTARGLRRDPRFSAMVVATLSLGIGASAALFSIADRLFFRQPAGVVKPNELRRISARTNWTEGEVTAITDVFEYAQFDAVRAALRGRVELAAYTPPDTFKVGDGEGAKNARGVYASANLWPLIGARTAIGRTFTADEDRTCSRVIGVVRDAHYGAVVEKPMVGLFALVEQQTLRSLSMPTTLVVRTTPGTGTAVADAMRRILRRTFPTAEPPWIVFTAETVHEGLKPWRLGAMLFSMFGALALLVAAVGAYSVIAYAVSQRTHEIGVRMALGARSSHVVGLVMGEGMRAVGIGIVVGVVASLAMGRLVASMLYNTSPRDPIVLVAVAATLAIVAIMASIVPAWRAASTDPAIALRSE